ncbi:MAG TPA: arsenate reductase (glutaredoxin) [Nitrospira sp.]|nr:arsenate reductase (glutaredoxin) [Nitrospira sp.]
MTKVTIYQKPTCSTCRQAVQLLKDSGTPFTAVNYYEERFTAAQLKALLKKAGLSPREILRTKEDLYRQLNLAKTTLSDEALIDVLVAHPDLIQRPIVVKGDKVLLARPAERVKEVL